MENYSVIGGWRDRYQGKQPVESTAKYQGKHIRGIDGLREYLIDEQQSVVRCITEKLMVYSTGAELTLEETSEMEKIASKNLRSGAKFRDIIVDVILSKTFQTH
jgi:hypothetical protein